MTTAPDQPEPPAAAAKKPKKPKRVWFTPGGISAIAAVLAVAVALIGMFLQRPAEPAGTPTTATPPSPSVAEPVLFSYGTSMPGMSRYDAISSYVVRTARDSVQGTLYDSGLGYPLARFGGDGRTNGVLLWLDPATAQAALTEMTRVEGGLFHPVQVRTASGVTAHAYQWIGSTDGYPRIDTWDGSTAGYGARAHWLDLRSGDCFQLADDAVLTMWCQAPHAWEVYFGGTLPSQTATADAAAESSCAEQFETFIGRAATDSTLITRTFLEPDRTGAERRYLCAVGIPGALSPGGSLEGSDR